MQTGGGVRVGPALQLPGAQVGSGKNNKNSGEGHELNGSMDTHEEDGCRRLCSIEISAHCTRSHVQLLRRCIGSSWCLNRAQASVVLESGGGGHVVLQQCRRGAESRRSSEKAMASSSSCGMCTAETLLPALGPRLHGGLATHASHTPCEGLSADYPSSPRP